MHIRTMAIDDYEGARNVWESCIGMGLNDVDDSREGIAKFLLRNPDTCFVAEDADGIVGTILVGHDGRRAHVYHLAVKPERRHEGIASQLIDSATQALVALSISKISLVAFSSNEEGNAFWESHGFHVRDDLAYRDKALTKLVRRDT